jgi:hypothetical protein
VLDSDLLLTFPAMAVEGLDQGRIGARQLVGLGKVLPSPLERLFANHGAAIALHCGVMGVAKPGAASGPRQLSVRLGEGPTTCQGEAIRRETMVRYDPGQHHSHSAAPALGKKSCSPLTLYSAMVF